MILHLLGKSAKVVRYPQNGIYQVELVLDPLILSDPVKQNIITSKIKNILILVSSSQKKKKKK
jgi:hypothetical protein